MPDPIDTAQLGRLLGDLSRPGVLKPPTQSAQPTLAPMTPMASHTQAPRPGEATIGASREGERYIPPSFNEIMAMKNPLGGVLEHVLGPARPPSVYAADPTGIDTWVHHPETTSPPGLLMGSTEEVGELARPFVTAYHGSPHEFAPEPGAPFGRFRSDKIGSGQGAQSYGHGHYLAEAEPVAIDYRNMLSRDKSSRWNYAGSLVPDPAGELGREPLPLALHLAGHPDPGEPMDAFLRRRIPDMEARAEYAEKSYPGLPSSWRRHAETLRGLDASRLTHSPAGHMYEARIQGDPAQFLDWDKHVNVQSAPVQEAIARLGAQPQPMERIWTPHQVTEGDVRHLRVGPNMQPGDWTNVVKDRDGTIQYHTGQTYNGPEHAQTYADARNVQNLQLQKFDTGSGLYQNLASVMGDVDASARLRDAGVPGIRYLDQFSRNATYNPLVQDMIAKYGSREGALTVAQQRLREAPLGNLRYWEDAVKALSPPDTRNYVVFPGNEHLIDIVRKYGLLPPLAGGAALGYRAAQDQVGTPPPVMAPSH